MDESCMSYSFGLPNNGNNCYMNSINQFLISSTYFNKVILSNASNNKLFGIYHKLLFNTVSTKYNIVTDLFTHISQSIEKKHNINVHSQNDSIEILEFIIGILNDKKIENLFKHTYNSVIYCNSCNFEKKTIDDNLFYQYLYDNKITNKILEEISFINGSQCRFCNTKTIFKKINIVRLPLVLIFLYNYSNTSNKTLNSVISFILDKKKYVYSLVSFIEYYGSGRAGHYTCTGIRKDGIYKFNDYNVTPELLNAKNTNNIYSSMYELKEIIRIN